MKASELVDRLGGMLVAIALTAMVPMCSHAYQNMGNDRILLMNNDSRPEAMGGVSHQGYYDTNAVTVVDGVESVGTYWTHEPDLDNTMTPVRFLLHGTTHILHAPEGDPLWRLVECRAGYVAAGASGRNSLPCSRYAQISLAPGANPTSLTTAVAVYNDQGRRVNVFSNSTNACIVLRNSLDAKVYSPLYKDGIGTLYFDTVNSFANATDGVIALQIATNLTAEASAAGEVAFEDVDKQIPFENWDSYYDWQTVPMILLEINGTSVSGPIVGVTNLLMTIADGGSSHYFRSRTKFNYYGPMRFRICRLTTDPGSGTADSRGLILIDNIIASYPPAAIRLDRYGGPYDPSLTGTSVIGCVGDFDKPFLSYADTSVNTRLHFSWVTNFQGTAQNLRLTQPRLNYRWRYLDQKISDWKYILLTTNKNVTIAGRVNFLDFPANTQLVSVAGIPLTDGVGDLEYFYTANVVAPYYEARDYANDSASVFGLVPGTTRTWTEAITDVTNRLEAADGFLTPALGKHYFTRIREGASDYRWVKLCTSVTTNGADSVRTEDLQMELVGDHTWRVHYYVPENMAGETLSFHFQGEQLFANEMSVGYLCRTNAWYYDHGELPHIPYTSAVGLEYRNDISCRLDDAATHLKIEFNDETLAFSVSHAAYQNFNTWTDAAAGYVGHTSRIGMGATGFSEMKRKFVLEMDGYEWTPPAFIDTRWMERFDTEDYITYPYNKVFDDHRTPNGWTAVHGQFVRAVRDLSDDMSLQMEGGGQGWIGMEGFGDDEVPQGVDTFKFMARLAQEPRFEDFAWYIDGTSMTNYAFSARLAMGHKVGGYLGNSPDISPGTPSVSLVGYYRPLEGCYEFRITRCGPEQLCAALYKWLPKSNGMIATLLASNVVAVTEYSYARPGPGQPTISNFGNYLVPLGTSDMPSAYGSNAYLLIYRDGSRVLLRGALSKRFDSIMLETDLNMTTLVEFTDTENVLTRGTYGIGSADCAATFMAMRTHELVTGDSGIDIKKNGLLVAEGLINGEWAFYRDRWTFNPNLNIANGGRSNLIANIPTNQTVRLEFKAEYGGGGWQSSGMEHVISTFSTNIYKFTPRVSSDYRVRLRTGGNSYDGMRTDVVVDNLEVSSWRAPDYPGLYYYFGQAANWVYMSGVVTNVSGAAKCVLLQPSRGVPERAMGIRSPYLENGISMFSASYRNADANARLLLQICTNLTYVGSVSGALTTYPPSNYSWTTVATFDFSTMTATERQSGTITHYMGYRAPVHGLVRLVVDEGVVSHCYDMDAMPDRDLNYGRIMIDSAYCYDEPALDMRSWYAWNFHTAGWNTADKRFAYLFDAPDGLSGSLNFSALESDNSSSAAQGIGLADQQNLVAYRANNSFIQCPSIANGIGSVSFRARTFETNSTRRSSWVTLYGSNNPDDDQVLTPESWRRIMDFEITNATYKTFSWSANDDDVHYKVIRLEVAGSRHGRSPGSSVAEWENPVERPLQRVFIDEVSVAEFVPGGLMTIAFDLQGGFLDGTTRVYALGGTYGTLPHPTLDGKVFCGWWTQPNGQGVQVFSWSNVVAGVTTLYALWRDQTVGDVLGGTRNWIVGGDVPWVIDRTVSVDGEASARSGAIGDAATSTIKMKVVGPGTLSFWWKASSEESSDVLTFLDDGNSFGAISGKTGWKHFEHPVADGARHVFSWVYAKNESGLDGNDCAWLDGVNWMPDFAAGEASGERAVPMAWREMYDLGNASLDIDTDGDGFTDWEEYVAGSSPIDQTSYFKLNIFMDNGQPKVTPIPYLGSLREYVVEGKTNLTDKTWIAPTNSVHRFFRATVELK